MSARIPPDLGCLCFCFSLLWPAGQPTPLSNLNEFMRFFFALFKNRGSERGEHVERLHAVATTHNQRTSHAASFTDELCITAATAAGEGGRRRAMVFDGCPEGEREEFRSLSTKRLRIDSNRRPGCINSPLCLLRELGHVHEVVARSHGCFLLILREAGGREVGAGEVRERTNHQDGVFM